MPKTRMALSLLGLLALSVSGLAPCRADWASDAERINRNFQKIDESVKRNEDYWKKKPGELQKPGEIQKPGAFQNVGEFRKALSEGKVIKQEAAPCHRRFCVGADTLFNFDEATLTPYAEEALQALGPMIVKVGAHPVKVEGHTDSEGTDQYNQKLSEKRAERVKNWLMQNHFVPVSSEMVGFGETRPRAPNKKPDGSDNPEGRALNRRVEIIVDTCTALPEAASSGQTTSGASKVVVPSAGGEQSKPVISTVDLSDMLPYANLFSSQEIKDGFANISVKPLGDPALSFEVLTPRDWEEEPLELTRAQLSQDSIVQIPLVEMTPKSSADVRLEVRYIRAGEDTNLGNFVKSFAQKSGFELLGRQPGEFNGRQVEDVLLRADDKSSGAVLTRLTASRHGDRIFLIACSCPEKEYGAWKRIFGAAAVSFAPNGTVK